MVALFVVLPAVQLDRQLGIRAGEVHYRAVDHVLADEAVSVQSSGSQMLPKDVFGIRGIVPHAAGEAFEFCSRMRHVRDDKGDKELRDCRVAAPSPVRPGHTPRASLRSLAPLSQSERGKAPPLSSQESWQYNSPLQIPVQFRSISSSLAFRGMPMVPPKPCSLPSEPMTRWQGMMMGSGLVDMARAAARAVLREPDACSASHA